MAREHRAEDYESIIHALAAQGGDILSKADGEGYPRREAVISWTDRVLEVILHQRDLYHLRAEIPALANGLAELLQVVLREEKERVDAVVASFFEALPRIRQLLSEDAEAAFEGDPAARGFAEILVAYPSIEAVATYRLAHELYLQRVPLLPRIMGELAHSRTGIDIHPGARIGRRFFIDHGTGVVIGETCEIGDRVKLYQGVTLGARSFDRGENGELLRGTKRHPTIENCVTIYAGSTILGGETVVGEGSVIGGNVWLTHSIPPCTTVQIESPRQRLRKGGNCNDASVQQLHWDI